ncbi:hypothetical protein METP1_03637 [Methanosarcinales archaeon]|nr:hypothetical protein METP1_03637 [Methanosarcinales archaeon]
MANNGYNKTLTIISINGPYRDEAAYTLIRLAHAAKEKGINVNFFNYLDGTSSWPQPYLLLRWCP